MRLGTLVRFTVAMGLLATGGVLGARLYTGLRYSSSIYTPEEAPSRRGALVFGAGLLRDGRPTAVLHDRVAAAVALYKAGKVDKLLMSGDNRFVEYNEPAAMREAAIELGVPADDIVLDYAGRRTYDSCYRARAIFGLSDVILVTQAFHLPRALYLCESLGLHAIGVASDLRVYRRSSQTIWAARELFATAAAVWDVVVARPLPVLGEPEPIE
jgi:SanA protein